MRFKIETVRNTVELGGEYHIKLKALGFQFGEVRGYPNSRREDIRINKSTTLNITSIEGLKKLQDFIGHRLVLCDDTIIIYEDHME